MIFLKVVFIKDLVLITLTNGICKNFKEWSVCGGCFLARARNIGPVVRVVLLHCSISLVNTLGICMVFVFQLFFVDDIC